MYVQKTIIEESLFRVRGFLFGSSQDTYREDLSIPVNNNQYDHESVLELVEIGVDGKLLEASEKGNLLDWLIDLSNRKNDTDRIISKILQEEMCYDKDCLIVAVNSNGTAPSASSLYSEVSEMILKSTSSIVIDLSKLEYYSSDVMNAILGINSLCNEQSRSLKVIITSSEFLDIVSCCKLDNVLDIVS